MTDTRTDEQLVDDLREQFAQIELDQDRNPTEERFVEWLARHAVRAESFDESLDRLFGSQSELDEACRALPKRSRSLAELREQDLATFFADRDASAGVA